MVAYWAGSKGGRSTIEKYGRYVLVLVTTSIGRPLFANYGEMIVFVTGYCPPSAPHIVSRRVARMNLKRFVFYTFAAHCRVSRTRLCGQKLGEKWNRRYSKNRFHRFDFVMNVAVLLAAWWIWRHIKHLRQEKQGSQRTS